MAAHLSLPYRERLNHAPSRPANLWGHCLAFALGSILAVLCQGLLLGGLIDGATGAGALPGDDPLGLVTPLGTICALGLIGGYGLIGAGWLVWKNGDAGTRVARRAVQPLLALTAAMLALGGVWGAWNVPSAATLTVTAAMLAVLAAIGHALAAERGARLFVLTMVLFALGLVALAALLWRSLLPLDATLWDSLANAHALGLLMAGITIALPLVLVHQAYAFRGFRRRPRVHGRRPGAARP
ncbi:cytochrome d ubiquinol oxidase subunit II [Ancylobacter sp. G4_0304]|uniref:cytochrome d ubiquinol oxidase subunit II n=1 Tax=Ancylobacter sp. G4_0304 TaxID=3114289 RepID=UPI0039C61606